MVSVWSVLKLASRAAIWRTTPDPPPVGLPSLLISIIAVAALRVALEFVAAGPGGRFNPYGLNAVVAWLALEGVLAALFVPSAARLTALSAMFALLFLAELAAYAGKIAVTLLPADGSVERRSERHFNCNLCFGFGLVDWRGRRGAAQLHAASAASRFRSGRGAVGGAFGGDGDPAACSGLCWPRLRPAQRQFVGIAACQDGGIGGERRCRAKPSRALRAVAAARSCKPKSPPSFRRNKARPTSTPSALPAGPGRMFFSRSLTADWPYSAIFFRSKGTRCALSISAKRSRACRSQIKRNFVAAVHAVGEVMNKNEDVLLLLMTSHGEPTRLRLAPAQRSDRRTDANGCRGDAR